jgi:hypothetical protein
MAAPHRRRPHPASPSPPVDHGELACSSSAQPPAKKQTLSVQLSYSSSSLQQQVHFQQQENNQEIRVGINNKFTFNNKSLLARSKLQTLTSKTPLDLEIDLPR